ncbi:NADPH-dependent FMN reductase [Paenibacillus sp. DMB20]|uniref:NADPH-dependent FMN reductase n=1 Tax=Paenibacillus sp. DMB20 TaxID=1642570 RepID=UPI000627905F|nr:NADPH-dependent FMN reductase [Paenibacillus sp. DMB20]KKO52518.1 FMN reductase [Paenibacillus sp. DMB20]
MTRIAFIVGSPTRGSRLFGLTGYLEERLALSGYDIDFVSAADLPAKDLLRADFNSPAIKQAVAAVEGAEAVIIASPVYKASYSGALKTILDLLPQKGLRGKVVLPVFIGGTIAHLLAVDYALKPVVAALGGTHILGGVFAVDQWISRLEDGGYEITEELKSRLDDALQELGTELAQYARDTSAGRREQAI